MESWMNILEVLEFTSLMGTWVYQVELKAGQWLLIY